jgi:hypothetical protein
MTENKPIIAVMRIKCGLLILGLCLLLLNACYGGITGKVVDADNGKPIEGAVVLVEWNITQGLGLSYTARYKTFETVTNENGWFTLPGVLNPFVNPPGLVIYKRGYVAWREYATFPDLKERKAFKWKSGSVFRLERFARGYLHDRHTSFISSGIGSQGTSSKLSKAIHWEELLATKERRLSKKKRDSLAPEEKSLFVSSPEYDKPETARHRKEVWNRIQKEVIQELYFSEKENPK